MQAVARGRRVRRHLAQAQAAARLTDNLSRPFTPDADFDLDSMQDFLDSLPDTEPLASPAPVLDMTSAVRTGVQLSPAAAVLSPSTVGQTPRTVSLSPSTANGSPMGTTVGQLSGLTTSLPVASSLPQKVGYTPQATILGSPCSIPAVLPSLLAAPVVAQAFAHTPALAKRFQALQKQQSGKSTSLQVTTSVPHVASSGLPPGHMPGGMVDGHSQDSDRRQSSGSALISGRAGGNWLAADVPAPTFALHQSPGGRSAQHAQHGQLQTMPEGGRQDRDMPSEQQGVSLPRIGVSQRANQAEQLKHAASEAHTSTPPASPSRKSSFSAKLPILKASSPPMSHNPGPRRVNSDMVHGRAPQPYRTASDIHTNHDLQGEASTDQSVYEGVGGTVLGPGSGPHSASSLQSEQSRSSQASYKAAVKQQRYKVKFLHMHYICPHCAGTWRAVQHYVLIKQHDQPLSCAIPAYICKLLVQ